MPSAFGFNDDISPILVAGAVNLGSSLFTTSRAAKKSYKYSLALQQQAQQWSERMSNTAHQREVADLRAAGLNPILSATGGSGATNSGATAGTITEQPASAGDVAQMYTMFRQQKNQNKLADSQTELNDEVKHKTQAEWSLIQEQENNAYEEGLNIMAQRDQIKAGTAKTLAETERQLIENKYYDKFLKSQIESNSANAWYNRHRALGFSDSYTDDYGISDSFSNGSLGPTNWFPSKGGSSAYSHKRSVSKTR